VARLDDDRYFAELEAEAARFAEAVHDADPALPVPTCPDWTLGRLMVHVAWGHRWAAAIVGRRSEGPVPATEVEDLEPPDGADERSAWLVAGARLLGDAARAVGPATEVWTWSHDRTAGFWLRRITHETLVHRLDAELAVGREVAVAADMAADSVTDLLSSLTDLSALGRADLFGEGETLHFHATDEGLGAAGEWFVRRTPTGVVWEQRHHKGDVAVRGRARDLLLVLYRKTALDASPVEVLGDRAVLASWLEHCVI
jgi:uncharacterized protein (TIGR03083 family)